MQQVGSSFTNESRVASRSPSVALANQNQVATLPVRLLRDVSATAQANDHAEEIFQVKMNAHGFAPEELVVQVDGRKLMMTGQHQEELSDPVGVGYRVKHKVHRQMQLPQDLDPAAMTCCLTPSGQLWVRGQSKALPPPEVQREPSQKLRGQSSKKGSNPA